ncbi:hypothetical protein SGRA_2207 [Saprospira grandis str. Lewin]|uniref:Lipoprotein n=2 Tax=Saprospira grandis TaxID=1008 RepID=H6L3I8_SAPGL|nr:hypothetical protein SGRA_2207 [Saprospira grandis str. Lewin]EJF53100.1 hypothetical protein SapgrDRAFT_1384 [Saprospira grandis DSM 2844]
MKSVIVVFVLSLFLLSLGSSCVSKRQGCPTFNKIQLP